MTTATTTKFHAKFQSGDIVATPTALDTLAHMSRLVERKPEQIAATMLERHLTGDWGDVDPEDKDANEFALEEGLRIMSVYHLGDSQNPVTFWLITEADRSVTTLLLPEDY